LSTWITFLAAFALHKTSQPLIAANLVFLVLFIGAVLLARRWPAKIENECLTRPEGTLRWDLIWLGAFLVFATWLMFATLSFKNGQFQIAFKAWTDFGANVSLTQSFALGHNFPPEHPFFPGEFIRYHFMFWFQTANLEFLGLNPVWSINILSVLSLLALLVEIMTLGEVLFQSRVVGRIAALLFFFSSSLSYIPFLKSQSGFRAALNSIGRGTEFLASGYPFRGETWGALSANVFAYQRHLISGIGLLVVVMVFIVDRHKWHAHLARVHGRDARATRTISSEEEKVEPAVSIGEPENSVKGAEDENQSAPEISRSEVQVAPLRARDFAAWIFSGAIIGLLPYWNSPTYVAALAIFGCLFVLMPFRLQTACLIGAA